MNKYDHKKIERKWQKHWEDEKTYRADDKSKNQKYYALIEFPYPSGGGLHVGHVRSYTAMDIVARKRRMEGYNVLYPIGWDAFGLPTENYAIKTGKHPKDVTRENTDTFRRQLKSLGFSFDWDREINTTDPDYYKWTQWMFIQFFNHDLAYKANTPINWCLSCKIGLANEEVVNGQCERCGGEVEKRNKDQWMIRITKYADKLLEGLETVDYISQAKIQQENWIGRSKGIDIEYEVENLNQKISVFTTRPDTNFGATFIAVAPESAFLVDNLENIPNKAEVSDYVVAANKKTDIERIAEGREKTGVFTGLYAINNLNGYKMPIYVADFVLATVGTGIVVGVPGHDIRDFEFARNMNIEVIRVVIPPDGDTSPITRKEQVQESAGTMVNSDFLDGLDIHDAKEKIMDYFERKKWGARTVHYKLRDWVFSRQRYWGEPIPLIYCEKCDWVPVPDDQLPVKLPDIKDYKPTDTGESPLAALEEWVNAKCPKCGGVAKRETDVMPNWAGSSWYFLRYIDPKNDEGFASMEKLKHWMPVDWYNGGMEHTVLHLLYSRFWNMFFHEIGFTPTTEPYQKRTSHGFVLGEGGIKMSKSKGNVINPDDLVEEFGADSLRLYEMFIGPFNQTVAWDPRGILGPARFLEKIWTVTSQKVQDSYNVPDLERLLHQAIKKVSEDIESMSFNTAVSTMMIFANVCFERPSVPEALWRKFLIILAPFAPHITEEIWQNMGNKDSVHEQPWPSFDPELVKQEIFELIIQINGKLRGKVQAEAGITESAAQALAEKEIAQLLTDKKVKKIVFVKDRLINLII